MYSRTSVIEPDRASVGAYGQDAKAQTLWEQVKASESWIAAERDKHRTKADAQRYGAAPIAA